MKMKNEHFILIRGLMRKGIEHRYGSFTAFETAYQTGNFPRADRVKDLPMRMRWDAYNFSVEPSFTVAQLYSYLDDNHIDTALKKCMKELKASMS